MDTKNVIKAVLNTRSLAVVGASNSTEKFGGKTMETIIGGGYDGQLYPVNPKSDEIMGFKAYKRLMDIPDTVDAVVIIVPARFVAGVLREAAEKGIKGAIILTAGFKEFGRMDLEEELQEISRTQGIRIMGPNIQGVTYLPNKMNAMFFPILKQQGPLAVITQSGSVTAALAEWAERDGVGVTAAINLGNQADICESDYIDYFADDPKTATIVCYLEGIKDGPVFLSALKKAVAKKPVVILKTGRTEAGAKSAASHTGSLAGSHEVFSGICRQYGAVSVTELTHLYDAAKGLALIKPPRGNRVVILSTSGGSATLASDEAESSGLVFPPLTPEAVEELGTIGLDVMAHITNPMDMPADNSHIYLKAAQVIDKYDIADIILFSFADPVIDADTDFVNATKKLTASVAACYFGGGDLELSSTPVMGRAGMAVYPTPERAIRGIGAAVQRSVYLKRRNMDQEV